MADRKGNFIWYELMTTDSDAAEAFYRGVLDWQSRDAGMPGMKYTLLSAGDDTVAGLMAMPDEASAAGARPGWMGHVAVSDVDATAAQFKQAGGTIHHVPTDIPGIGRFAVVADPQGAVLGLFNTLPEYQNTHAAPNGPGHAGWRELAAADGPTAFPFYAGVFGWTKGDAVDMGPMGTYQLFAPPGGGDAMGGMMTKPPSVPAPFWLYYFNVDGIDAAVDRVGAGGGKVLNGPHQVPGGTWIAQCLDPQGAPFALAAPAR
jgi:uncharacterized protein